MAEDVKHVDRWEWCDVMRAYVNYQDGQYVLAEDYDALRAEVERLRAGIVPRDDDMIVPSKLLDEINAAGAEWKARAQRAEAQAAELAEALQLAMEWNWLDDDSRPSRIADTCDAALSRAANDTQAGERGEEG